jgi:hypothetical protein
VRSLTAVGWNSFTDLVLTLLPFLILKNLKLELKIRIGLSLLIGMSVLAIVACIVRTIKLKSLGSRTDFTYNMSMFVIWVTIEKYIVIIASSIPTLRPLALKFSRRGLSELSKTIPSRLAQASQSFHHTNKISHGHPVQM